MLMTASSAAHLLGSLVMLRDHGGFDPLLPVGRVAMIAPTASRP